jgi:hypothetical protein
MAKKLDKRGQEKLDYEIFGVLDSDAQMQAWPEQTNLIDTPLT